MHYNSATLSNGIRIIHHHYNSPVTYCGFAVNVGTRDELPHQYGLAHFIEHMLFKGTTNRKSWHVLNRLETIGGTLDAYTTKEETVIYSAIPSAYYERAMELHTDLLFRSTFPQHEVDKEVDVVLDEIQSYNDSPAELIFDEFDTLLFGNSQLGHNILGSASQLKQYQSTHLHNFVHEHYAGNKIVFFVSGDIAFKRALRLAYKYLEQPIEQKECQRIAPLVYTPQQLTLQKDTYQTHCILGNRAYPIEHKKRTTLFLLNHLLGGPCMNSRLNLSIRERNGLAYTIESEINTYSDSGSFTIYFGCDHKNSERCIKLCEQELKKLRENRLSDTALRHYKRQVVGQLMIASQNRENTTLSMARSFLHLNRFDNMTQVTEALSRITTQEILEVANEVFDPSQLSLLLFK